MPQSDRDPRDVAGLKFDGGRFDEPGFSLAAANTLVKYHALVLEAAKILFRQDHPNKRLPNHFSRSIHLGLIESREGSTKPVIASHDRRAGAENPLIRPAIKLIDDVFDDLINNRSGSNLDYARRIKREIFAFNKALDEPERVFFRDGTPRSFMVDEPCRKKISDILSEQVFNVPGTLIGQLFGIDIDGKFDMRTPNGATVEGHFDTDSQFADLHKLAKNAGKADWIWVTGKLSVPQSPDGKTRITETHDFGAFGSGAHTAVQQLSELSLERLRLFGTSIPIEVMELCSEVASLDHPLLSDVQPAILLGADADEVEDGGLRVEWLIDDAHLSVDVSDNLSLGYGFFRLRDSTHRYADDIQSMERLRRLLYEVVA